jgi:hypothetical protein
MRILYIHHFVEPYVVHFKEEQFLAITDMETLYKFKNDSDWNLQCTINNIHD